MCTGIQFKSLDGNIVFARTMEFTVDIHSEIIVIPRGYKLQSHSNIGMTWTTKYACVGANAEKLPLIVEGVNEKGLCVGAFYFSNFAKYQSINNNESYINSVDVCNWLLTQCANVTEAIDAIKSIKVSNAPFEPWGRTCPLHYIVNDTSGDCFVIEYINGELHIHENKIGVFTNSPDFRWHLINLSNYINLSPINAADVTINGEIIKQLGYGTGLLGLPGDFTPPSRFVRAAVFSHTILATKTVDETLAQAFHVLNNFDIPKGSIRELNNDSFNDHTLWTSAIDLYNQRYYFCHYNNRAIQMVDLNNCKLDATDIQSFKMAGKTRVESLN
jgi:choloylglycine hydrolase